MSILHPRAEDVEQAWNSFQPTIESILTGRSAEESEHVRQDVRCQLEQLLQGNASMEDALDRIDSYVSRTYPRGRQARFGKRRMQGIRGGKAPRLGGPKD